MSSFFTYVFNGISLGSVYAIIALGYTMVYGIAKMLNFAHGDVIMIGGYVLFSMIYGSGTNVFAALIVAMVVCTVLGVVIEKVAYKPLREASSLAVLITAIGVSILLQNIAQLIFTSHPKMFRNPIKLGSVKMFGANIEGSTILMIVLGIIIVVALSIFIRKTKTGRAMLAVSEDKDAAKLMGINVNTTITITFAIGSALAALASLLMFNAYPSLIPTSGSMPGIKAFVAAVFGGIGSIPGAMVGGIVLGIIEVLSGAYIPNGTKLANAIVFVVLIVVLIFKPTGLFGKKIKEKV